MQVRRVQPEDHDEWLRMRLGLWPDHPVEGHQREMMAYGGRGALSAFVAVRADGGLCGFVEASLRSYVDGCETNPVGYIEGWYVDADARHQGVGRRLLEAAESWARDVGCREMGSDCKLRNLVSARAHAALGYEETVRLIHFKKALDAG